MDTAYTGSNGNFYLKGCASDFIGSIDPVLHVYHACKQISGKPQELKITIDQSFIERTYNATLNLALPPVAPKAKAVAYTKPLKPTCG